MLTRYKSYNCHVCATNGFYLIDAVKAILFQKLQEDKEEDRAKLKKKIYVNEIQIKTHL